MRQLVCGFFILAAVFARSPLAASEPSWHAGLARRTITPEKALWMAGYGGRTEPAQGKLQDLYLKVVALKDSDGNRAIFMAFDLLGIPQTIYNNTCASLKQELGLERSQIMLASSHTHCGPVLRGALLDIYPLSIQQTEMIEEYSIKLEQQIVATAKEAFANLAPATLKSGSGTARFAVNRRNNSVAQVAEYRKKGIDLKGPIDHAVPVLAVHSGDDRLIAVVFGYACHNTTLSFNQWCGDYAGFAQEYLEERHPGVSAMFYSGCGADQNPLPRRTVSLCQNYGRQLADAVDDVLKRKMEPLKPTLQTSFAMPELVLGDPPTREELIQTGKQTNYRGRWARRLLKEFDDGKPFFRTYPYPVQAWKLGGKQWWISLGGEVVVDFSLRIKRELDETAWIAGYANDVMAYIPSLRVLREGGYEGATSMAVYGMPAFRWAEDVEERVMKAIHGVVSKIKDDK